jgi:hypothetical protein
MKFTALREFKEEFGLNIERLSSYLSIELAATLRELRTGLSKLSFADNFESFSVSVTIGASEELPIRNEFRDGRIPSGWIAIRKDEYALSVCDGDTEWDRTYVYLKNTHATQAATLTVVFFR